jgi:D12 class N6 adenine-specific DNA methyltransferase
MKPFFSYFGAKWNLSRNLLPPQHDLVIEPFAGSACYSTRYEPPQVLLADLDETIVQVWRFLIGSSSRDIMNIPVDIDHVDDSGLCEEGKLFLGFWFDPGCAKPVKRRSNWARKFRSEGTVNVWSPRARERIACQVDNIKHWRIYHGSYHELPDKIAHWHIDPPYIEAGKEYRCNNSDIDYAALARWCRERRGFVQVCEAEGADWLPFKRFARLNGIRAQSRNVQREREYYEVLYEAGRERVSFFNPTGEKKNAKRDRTGTDRGDRRQAARQRQPAKVSGRRVPSSRPPVVR